MIVIKPLCVPDSSRLVVVCKSDGLWYVMRETKPNTFVEVAEGDSRLERLPSYTAARDALVELEERSK